MRLSVRALACALALAALLAAHVSATTVEATESAIDAALAAEEAEHADAERDAELDRTETRAEARHEMGIRMPEGASLLEVGNDKADSGGCTPLTVWENYDKNSYWWNWEKRLPDLARRTVGVDDGTASETVFHALGDNLWMQYIDGWAHDKGANAFGAEYVNDMRQASGVVGGRLKNGFGPRTFGLGFYDHIHGIAFQQTAGLLNKVNGFRGENSWIYLPVPDKPLGVFHDIHNYGKLNYDPHLRVIDTIKGTYGLNWNGGIQYRWVYPNVPVAFGRQKVRELFRKFWFDLSKIRQADPIGVQREQALQAVVLLYHSLENFHCFVDGNGRTNILVLQSLLSFVGLHPVSFYNSMESALCSVEEMREKVLEGYFRWEDIYRSGRSPWSQHELARKAGECKRAIDQLMGHAPTWNFGAAQGQTPDTMGGCTCRDVNSCNSNGLFNGNQWCFTDSSCTWTWDYCAPGRRRR